MDLALLDCECRDGGYAAHHHLSRECLDPVWSRVFDLLDAAEGRSERHPDIEFWRRYRGFILHGEPVDRETVAELARGDTLVPYLYLFGFGGDDALKYRDQPSRSLDAVRGGRTCKERYIRSVPQHKLEPRRRGGDRRPSAR